MNAFARTTASFLIVMGILIILGDLAFGVTGALHAFMSATTAARPLRAGGSIGLIAMIFIFVEGLTVTAIGEGLYLLAALPDKLRPA